MKKGGTKGPTGALAIVLSCPKCGAPFTIDDETVTRTCDHCGSLLILSAPDRDEIYVADGRIQGPQDVLEIVILYRVQAQRAEIVHRYQDQDGNPPAEYLIQARLRDYERQLRGLARLLDARCLHVPYWHVTGKIVQGILGRHRDGPKLTRLRAFAVEHTVPGYDTREANLRDRGLRLSAARVRPLTARDVREKGSFLPFLPVPEQSYREIDKWRGQDLDPEMEPVTKQGLFLFPRRVLVYRPYWLARVIADKGQEGVLADGTFETIAGYPDEFEARALLGLAIPDPLRSGEETYRKVHIIASRCPDCGFEAALDRRYTIVICANCHRALKPQATGISIVPCAHARGGPSGLDADQLPFWRYGFRVQLRGGKPLDRLEDYARAVFPQGPPPGFQPSGSHLWVPAFRLLGTEAGDEAFKGLLEWIHARPPEVQPEKVPLGGKPTLWGVSLPEQEARAVAPLVLFGLHGKQSASRLTTLLVKKTIQEAQLSLSDPTLVMIPFEREGDALRVEGALRIPLLLLRGGPELDSQRATVHAAGMRA